MFDKHKGKGATELGSVALEEGEINVPVSSTTFNH